MKAKDYRRIHGGKGKTKGKPRQCWFCKELIPPHLITKDHIVPRSMGGRNDGYNKRWACKPCNQARGNNMDDPLITRSLFTRRYGRSKS